jgi:5'-nucleotidase
VKLALAEVVSRKPDIVIGGINHGDNASVNAHYSGTMGVTLEGCMKYIPSVAFSLCDFRADADFEPMRPLIRDITKRVLKEGLPQGVCLNVNFPLVSVYHGVKVCRMCRGTWGQEVTKCHHPRGYDYWWMVGQYTNDEPDAEDTDRWALENGYVAITPTQIDLTAYQVIDMIKSWGL